jgi:hypothetical protein
MSNKRSAWHEADIFSGCTNSLEDAQAALFKIVGPETILVQKHVCASINLHF